jgi:transposase
METFSARSDAAGSFTICIVQIDLDALPDDATELQQMLRAVLLVQGELRAENDGLRLLIQRLSRHQFGRRSEQLSPDQLQLGLEDLEQTIAANQAAQATMVTGYRRARSTAPARNHGDLPAHLPRYEVVIDIEDHDCPCCRQTLTPIGEIRTEQLDIVPMQLRVRVTCRPRYVCRSCDDVVVVAPAPDRPIEGGMPTEALVAHVVVSKFADAQPLYRQVQILSRQGMVLDRSTLANWVGRACWWLQPLYDLLVSTMLASPKVFADETTLPVLEPGRGRTKTGRLWCCQRRSNFPQNCRSKTPQFCRSRPGVGVTIFGWPPTWPGDRRRRWRCDNRFGTDVLGHELGVLAQSVAGALDLHDHSVVEQAVQ